MCCHKAFFDTFDSLVNLFIPERCGVCGNVLVKNEKHLCTDCIRNMPLTWFWLEERNPMADRLNERLQESILNSGPQHNGHEQYSFAIALYFYRGNYRELSKRLKYNADVTLGRYVAKALGRKAACCGFLNDVELIIPVPLHPLRRFRRGYNQSGIIADEIAGELSKARGRQIETCTGLLHRVRLTRTQTKLGNEAKKKNVSGAFRADFSALDSRPAHILLVDDVFTTGNTLCECHRALRNGLVRKYGAAEASMVRISVATLAFVGE